MRPISAKDGKMQEDAGLNMRQLRHMDLILSTRIRLIAILNGKNMNHNLQIRSLF